MILVDGWSRLAWSRRSTVSRGPGKRVSWPMGTDSNITVAYGFIFVDIISINNFTFNWRRSYINKFRSMV